MKMLIVARDAQDGDALAAAAGCQGFYRGVPPRLAGSHRVGDIVDEGQPATPPQPTPEEFAAQRAEAARREEARQRHAEDAAEAQAFRDLDANWPPNASEASKIQRRLVRLCARLERRLREAGL